MSKSCIIRGLLAGFAILGTSSTVLNPTPTQAAPGFALPGVSGSYYSDYWNGDPNFFSANTPVFSRIDSAIAYSDYDANLTSWGFAGTPLASQELFSVLWTGSLVIETPGNYEFRTLSDDGIQLFVDNSSVIANTTIHAPTYDYGSIALAAGIVPFKVYYGENYILSVAELSWKLPGAADFTPINSVPGPLPLLGAGAAFHASRRLRQRVKKSYSIGS
jgi:hypothetical protein